MGHLNSPDNQPWNHLKPAEVHSPAHINTARVLAGKGIVLLKNAKVRSRRYQSQWQAQLGANVGLPGGMLAGQAGCHDTTGHLDAA